MADNYLERKMEDLRRGKLRHDSQRSSGQAMKGFVRLPMPSRRVMIIGGCSEPYLSVARIFLKRDCKVAVVDSDITTGEKMASKEGIRFIAGDPSSEDNLKEGFQNIVSAWRDIDIIICPPSSAQFLSLLWMKHKERFPIPSEYGGRVIVISDTEDFHLPETGLTDKFGINVNHISLRSKEHDNAVASLALFLSLPDSSAISGNTIFVG